MVKQIGGIFLLVGIVVLSLGGYFYWNTQEFVKRAQHVTGKVIEMQRSGKNTYAPVVQFETSDHRTITGASKISSNPPTHAVSDSVTVLYRPEDPDDFRLDEPLDLWFLPCLVGGLGSVFFIIGAAMMIFSRGAAPQNNWISTKT